MKITTLVYIVLTILVWSQCLVADHHEIETATVIKLFMKIVSYDRSFDPDKCNLMRIYVLYDKKDVSSYRELVEIEDFLADSDGLKVKGVSLQVHAIEISSEDSLWADLDDSTYHVLVLTSMGDDTSLDTVMKFTSKHAFSTFSLDPTVIGDVAAVGVALKKNKPTIMISRKLAELEGREFSAHLLKLSTFTD